MLIHRFVSRTQRINMKNVIKGFIPTRKGRKVQCWVLNQIGKTREIVHFKILPLKYIHEKKSNDLKSRMPEDRLINR